MNLLPLVKKSAVRREYYKRLAVVALILFAALILISIIPITVSYIASTYEIMDLERELALVTKTNIGEGVVASMDTIKDQNSKLDTLSGSYKQGLNYDLSAVFFSIIDGKLRVRLTSLVYDKITLKKGQAKTVGHRVVLGGVADDRDSLLDFVKKLESDKRFVSIDLPVSNLIESKDIKFFITIMLVNK